LLAAARDLLQQRAALIGDRAMADAYLATPAVAELLSEARGRLDG
jgi:hypothetical protein